MIKEKDILKVIKGLLKHPQPTICRHAVCCDLLSMLERGGMKIGSDLAKAVVEADDAKAISLLTKISK